MVMPRNVTVQFNDGTSHVYEDVPDSIHDSEVDARAKSQFGKDVAHVQAEPMMSQQQGPNLAEKAIGAAQTAGEIAMEHPLLTGGAALGAAKYGTIKGIANQGLQAMDAFTTSRNFQALQGLEHQARQYTKAGQAIPQGLQTALDTLRNRVAGPVAPSAPPVSAPAGVPPTVSSQPSVLQRATEFARQGMARAHAVGDIAMQKVLQNAGNIGRAGVGLGAALYSPGLNTNEQQELQRRRGMGPTITQ
jgi:hypothetical protein